MMHESHTEVQRWLLNRWTGGPVQYGDSWTKMRESTLEHVNHLVGVVITLRTECLNTDKIILNDSPDVSSLSTKTAAAQGMWWTVKAKEGQKLFGADLCKHTGKTLWNVTRVWARRSYSE